MAGAEGVVLALIALEEAGHPPFLAELLEAAFAPGEHFVRIALVTDVPDELVLGCVEHAVQRDGEFDDTQPGADVATGARAGIDERRTDVLGELSQLVAGEGLEVGGIGDAVENGHLAGVRVQLRRSTT